MATDEAAEGPFDEATFFAAETWILTWAEAVKQEPPTRPIPADAIVQVDHLDTSGRRIAFVPAFTDEDLASRFVGRLGHPAGTVRAIRLPDLAAIRDLFERLQPAGVEYVSYDPGETRVFTVPIGTVLEGLRRPR